MRIKRITVKKYKNLVDFDCEFSDSNISAFIGNNGAGKSNVLEVITLAFSTAKNVAADKKMGLIVFHDIYGCKIEYEYNGVFYTLCVDKSDICVLCDEKQLTEKQMLPVLPDTIMLYYAGETDRQQKAAKVTFDEKYNNALKSKVSTNLNFPGFKFLDYYSTEDINLLLLTAAVFQGDYYEKLLKYLNCSGIETSTSLTLMNPKGKSGDGGTYWNAHGFVKSFLDELRKYVSATVDLGDIYRMVFKDISLWSKTSENEAALFARLKALKSARYLYMLDVNLIRDDGSKFAYYELSEGEKQLVLLYLLTSFTAKNNCLYLFDEFDSYLHLNWQRSISEMLRNINVDGHIIFTTHSPGTISQIKKDNLYIMRNGQVVYPASETFNRALDEIMLEQMDVSMLPPEVEDLYDKFKQSVAERKKEQAEHWMKQLEQILDKNNPLFLKMRINLRRI